MSASTSPERVRIEPGWDLVDGVLVEKDMGNQSDFVAANVLSELWTYGKSTSLGRVFGQGAGYQYPELDGGRLKFPDVSYVSKEKHPGPPPKSWANFPPDLVVEVVSPNDEAEEVQAKVGMWLAGGVRLVWVAYPEAREIVVHHPDRTSRSYVIGEELTGEDVLPGFQLSVAAVFEGLSE